LRKLLLIFLLLFWGGCRDQDIIVNVPTAPTPTLPVVTLNIIEYRVSGNAIAAQVRLFNPVDGVIQTQTVLPYNVSVKTDQEVMFLSLDATPINYPVGLLSPFMSVQIFVNGALFREASSSSFFISTISAAGTWRK
jgi:hypothetical protein